MQFCHIAMQQYAYAIIDFDSLVSAGKLLNFETH